MIVFIYYHKEKDKIKALPYVPYSLDVTKLLKAGWVHTATLDVAPFLEQLYNENNDYKTFKQDLIKDV